MTGHAALMDQMKRLELTEAEVLAELEDARLISDNCVRLWDIAEPDLSRAVQFLTQRQAPKPKLIGTFRDKGTGLRMGRYQHANGATSESMLM